jgi:thiamine biosynthesis lipoprotein
VQYKQQLFPEGIKLFYAWFEAMHTRVDVAFCVDKGIDNLELIAEQVKRELENYERIANRFDTQSELHNVNENATSIDVKISTELCAILVECQHFNQQTNGYFDISVYSKNGFCNNGSAYNIDTKNNTVRFAHEGVLLDLSGFIKGYALNKVVDIIHSNGVENALINVGNSSIFAMGNHPYGTGWKIKIPETDADCILQNECLTTSGNTDSTKWPIINPLNGNIEKLRKPTSVLTKSAALGEVLAKVAYLATETERENIFQTFEAQYVN